MTKILKRRFIGLIAISTLLFLAPLFSLKAMTVSPVRLELSGDPGTIVNGSFKATNDEENDQVLYTIFENFEASGETGSPSFKPGDSEGLASWITAPSSVTIAPGENKNIDFTITIPADAEAGGYFSAIFLATAPPNSNSNELAIGSRIGTLLLFRVNGDIIEGGDLIEFATKDAQKWYSALPINFYYRFQNSGADRVFPKSTLTIKNMIGRSTAVIDANQAEGNVLPGSIRRFEVWWQDKDDASLIPGPQPENQSFFETIKYQWNNFAFGRYSSKLDVTYGANDKTVSSNFSLFVFPWQLLLVEMGILLIAFFLLSFLFKKYNRWIIKKSRS
jgi:hypothetical protein